MIAKDLLASAALGFVFFIRVWNALLRENYYQFFAQVQRNRYDYGAILLNTLLLGALFFCVASVIRARRPVWLHDWAAVALILCLAPLVDFGRRVGSVRAPYLFEFDSWPIWVLLVGALTLAAIYRVRFTRVVYRVLLGLAPLALWCMAWAGYWYVSGSTPPSDEPAPAFADTRPTERRVVWLIFDELDGRATYAKRPATVRLPAFDELLSKSVQATNAYPPAGLTFLSLPSLLSGRYVLAANVRNGRQLDVRYRGESSARTFPEADTLPNQLQAEGKRTALFGWFFPYERMFPATSARRVKSFAFPQTHGFSETTLPASMLAQVKFALMPPLLWHKNRQLFEALHRDVLDAIRDPATDFVFAHYSVPHAPGIFARPTMSRAQAYLNPTEEYFGNLRVADRALADIMDAVRHSEAGARTVILVSSDHWWRASAAHYGSLDNRVPFLVSMPDRKQADYPAKFNVVETSRLVREIFAGTVKDSATLLDWLGTHRWDDDFTYGPGGEIRIFENASTRKQ